MGMADIAVKNSGLFALFTLKETFSEAELNIGFGHRRMSKSSDRYYIHNL